MKANDHFIEWLREKILQNPQEPPAEAWTEISDALDMEESWEKIGEELELNQIWNKIDNRLHRYNLMLRYDRIGQTFSAAAALLLMLGHFILDPSATVSSEASQTITREYHSGERKNEPAPFLTNSVESSKGSSISASTNHSFDTTKISLKVKKNNKQKHITSSTSITSITLESLVTEEITVTGETKVTDRTSDNGTAGEFIIPPSKPNSISEEIIYQEIADRVLFPPLSEPLPMLYSQTYILDSSRLDLPLATITIGHMAQDIKENRAKEPFRHYPTAYIGSGTALKASWLMNSKTLYALEKNSLLEAAPAYQADWYFLYGTRLSERLFLQTDIYLRDVVGQQYQEYRHGTYGLVKEKINYQSISFNMSHLRRQVGFGKYSTYSRLLGGVYAGRLQNAEELSQAGRINTTHEYAQYHLGVIGGYEYDTFLHKNLILSYGLRSRLDLTNIYSGTETTPAAFRRTRGLSIDFSLSLKYLLKK